jgi:hypothetical protein
MKIFIIRFRLNNKLIELEQEGQTTEAAIDILKKNNPEITVVSAKEKI